MRSLVLTWLLLALVGILISGCSSARPQLRAITPERAYPRQLLTVNGTTTGASVVWDIGLPTEQVLTNGLFGTVYFQVPQDAGEGPHPVAIQNAQGASAPVTVTVLPAQPFPEPRIEDVGVLVADGPGPVTLALTVSAANLDVDATVTVVEAAGESSVQRQVPVTVRWGGLSVDYLQDHAPDTFGYPIYHYAQLLSVVEEVSLGSKLLVTVTNTDGKQSTRAFDVPANLANLDGDGDGLLDSWEDGTYMAPSGNSVPLAAMGTRKWKKDLLIEVDWIAAAQPKPELWSTVESIFNAAPVLNPDGSSGIQVIIDRGQGGNLSHGGEVLEDHDFLTYDNPPAASAPSGGPDIRGFFEYKAAHFDPDRLLIFHYAIFGRSQLDGSSGLGERFGNDFFVTLLDYPFLWALLNAQAGHFVHELGHNLGFSHEGPLDTTSVPDFRMKPNLPSLLNYRYTAFGVDATCDLIPDGLYTFSQGTLRSISEADADETAGVCDGVPVDMDGDSNMDSGPKDINDDGDVTDVWDDFDQWGALLLKFDTAGSGWNHN